MMAKSVQSNSPNVWVLLDDRSGNQSQCIGVAQALGIKYQVKTLKYSIKSILPNWLVGSSYFGLISESRASLVAPWPDIVISAGRRSARVRRSRRG